MKLGTKKLRPAIAMIELIFALVIMGIIMSSAPLLISNASKSGFVSMQQEAINEAASQLNIILGYQWDENNTNELYLPTILTASGDTDLNVIGTTGRRLGTPEESTRTFIRSDGIKNIPVSTTLGFETGEVVGLEDDMDDFSGTTNLVEIVETVDDTEAEYIETTTIQIATTITYNNDGANYNQSTISFNPFTAVGGTSNIKQITATLTSTSSADELDKEIKLHAFSCNIGSYELAGKAF